MHSDYFDYICIIDNSNLFFSFFLISFFTSVSDFFTCVIYLGFHLYLIAFLSLLLECFLYWLPLCITMCKCKLSQSISIFTLYFKGILKTCFHLGPLHSQLKSYIYIYMHLFQVFPLHTLTQQMLLISTNRYELRDVSG